MMYCNVNNDVYCAVSVPYSKCSNDGCDVMVMHLGSLILLLVS